MTTPTFPTFKPCPCGSGRSFGVCCAPFLAGERDAPTAEALMRSRYTGYVVRAESYLLRTWHPDTRPASLDLHEDHGTRWQGLTVRRAERGGPEDTEGVVEFEARFRSGANRHRLREQSTFARHEGRWVYVDGVVE